MLEVIIRETEEVEIDKTKKVKKITEEVIWSFPENFKFQTVAEQIKAMVLNWTFHLSGAFTK